MTDPPPTKKLKQTTIIQSFKSQNSTSIGNTSVEIVNVECETISEVDVMSLPKSEQPVQPLISEDGADKLPVSPSHFDSNESWEREYLKQEPGTSTNPEHHKEKQQHNSKDSLGERRDMLKTSPNCSELLPPLKASPSHIVLYSTNNKAGGKGLPQPYPRDFEDKWDDIHVKMPCSGENLYPVPNKNGKAELQSRWKVIAGALQQPMANSLDLEEAILSYNKRYAQKWCFRGLHAFFLDVLGKEESRAFFKITLPKIANLAFQLPHLCTKAIPLLRKQKLQAITISQQQVACLLANAFFCTFPRRNARARQSEYSSFPEINFIPLFQGPRGGRNGINYRKAEKLKCILNYFKRITTKMPTGVITFRRQLVKDFPMWEKSTSRLTRLNVTSEGTIEDEGIGMRQVDFANKYLGGGVLGQGCVQEEIRFLICPEMIISRLFTEALDDNECLIMTGCERFNNYTGYADSFRWNGNYEDQTVRDSWGRQCTEVVAIDALVYRSYINQFQDSYVCRELNKAYCGFLAPGVASCHLPAIATGNWGCGAFGGDLSLKALIQLMAAAQAQRDVCYFTFGDCSLRDQLFAIHQLLTEKKLEVSDLWALIQQYYSTECRKSSSKRHSVFEFIQRQYNPEVGDSDHTDDTEPNLDFDEESQEHEAWQDSPDFSANTP